MIRRKLRPHFKLLILSAFIFLAYLLMRNTFQFEIDRETLLQQMNLTVLKESNSQFCTAPNLPVYSPEMMKFIHNVPAINCSAAGMDWVKCKDSICSIQAEIKALYGDIECEFTYINRDDDFKNSNGKTSVKSDSFHMVDSDVVKVACKSKKRKWSTVLTSIRRNDTLQKECDWGKVPKDGLKMNVLMFGVDSVSRNLFIRKLPRTYDYIQKNLKGIVLEGYNIVGDGTPQALIPILTGKTELELPDTRKRFKGTKYVNSYPFIWNEFKNAGYVTGFLEDLPNVGTFTYRLNGFKEVPTDHYMRPYYLAETSEHKKWPKYCTAGTPRHVVMTNFIKDFFNVYRNNPKFLFGFHGELSHDDHNLVGAADQDFKDFLSDLHDSNLLNNTVLIFFADHGHRFAAIRNTLQGKLEERLPFFSIILPHWFRKQYSTLYENLKKNVKRLSTPFDIHATLRSILNVTAIQDENRSGRSISLFSEISKNRTCSMAFIEPHWCSCLSWHTLEENSDVIPHLTNALISTLNNYTSQYRNLCDTWKLKKVNWATKLIPNDKLLRFKTNADKDGFLGDFSAETKIEQEMYQISVELEPDNALFEASVSHVIKDNSFNLKISDISRINMYRNQASCFEDRYPHLRKYCHCRN